MRTQVVIIALAALFVGFGVGTSVGHLMKPITTSKTPAQNTHTTHTMTMDTMMQDMNAALRGKQGDELDRAFLEEMIVHHQGAVEMAKILQEGTTRPELQALAEDIITAQEGEIAQMQEWQHAWFGHGE